MGNAKLRPSAIERFNANVAVNPETLCWEWQGRKNNKGYGVFWAVPRVWLAHRWIYEHLERTVPAGLELDHVCRNTRCVNPDHLEPVTHQVNILRGNTWGARNAAITHCTAGHPYDKANTLVVHRRDGRVERMCRTCKELRRPPRDVRNEQQRRWYRLRQEAKAKATEPLERWQAKHLTTGLEPQV